MKRVYLHGALRDQFGSHYDFDASSPAEALRAMIAFIPGFRDAIREGEYKVIRGGKNTGFALDIDEIRCAFGKSRVLHMIPVLKGSGGGRGGGTMKTIIGVALIAIAIAGAVFTGGMSLSLAGVGLTIGAAGTAASIFGAVASIGIGITLAGVSSLLSPRADIPTGGYSANEAANEKPSYLFNTQVNRSSQGAPVPMVYGKVRTGSHVVSVGLTTERI